MITPVVFRRPTRCDSSSCVEVAVSPTGAAIRDSVEPDIVLAFDAGGWRAFLDDVRAGRYDRR